jgi:glycosyltransferase involved in cell wall biosynthesis
VGPREILADGRYGSLVPVGDWQAMAQALRRAIDQPGLPPGAARHAWQFTDAAACSAYRQLLDSLAPNPREAAAC